jgi:RNA polymerase sigma-70 factor (ECF subfamily)
MLAAVPGMAGRAAMRDRADGELMDLYARGSEAAFDELFRRYEARAYGYFTRRVRCESRARDLYQELFLRLHRFRSRYDPTRPFEPWFFQVAHSVLVDEWRRQHRRAEVALDDLRLESREAGPEETAAAREAAARALDALPAEHARILVDAKVRGMEHGEIAESISKSVDAVKQTASRSLRRLRASHAR